VRSDEGGISFAAFLQVGQAPPHVIQPTMVEADADQEPRGFVQEECAGQPSSLMVGLLSQGSHCPKEPVLEVQELVTNLSRYVRIGIEIRWGTYYLERVP
jgi:hypothetical protein